MFIPNFDTTLFKNYNFDRGQVIKNEGDICNSIGIIITGKITISNITLNNKEYTIDTLNEGDLFGENLVFAANNYYPGSIISLTNSKIIFISKKNFIILLKNDDYFLDFYLTYISSKFLLLQNKIKILSQNSLEEKFLYYLQLKTKHASYVEIKSITFLSTYLNIPRPSLSRIINKLIKEGRIKREGKRYYIK